MTPTAGQNLGLRSRVWPFRLPADGARIPELLRERLLAAPRPAVRNIRSGSVPDPLLLNTVRAELFVLLGQRTTAAEHATAALEAVHGVQAAVPGRLLLVMTVLADIRCCTGDPYTAGDSAVPLDLARPENDHRRAGYAEALRCVARDQHTDCEHGRRLPGKLRDQHQRDDGGTPVTAMLTDGLTGMQQLCAQPPTANPLRTTPPGVPPSGLLHPDLRNPPTGYLSSRVRTQPGRHSCRCITNPAASPGGRTAGHVMTGLDTPLARPAGTRHRHFGGRASLPGRTKVPRRPAMTAPPCLRPTGHPLSSGRPRPAGRPDRHVRPPAGRATGGRTHPNSARSSSGASGLPAATSSSTREAAR